MYSETHINLEFIFSTTLVLNDTGHLTALTDFIIMSERFFRLVLGTTLWTILIFTAYFETMIPVYTYVGFLLFEGITNLRMTLIADRLRYGTLPADSSLEEDSTIKFQFDSERALRIILACLVLLSFTVLPDFMWFLPWFFAGMLILAGTTNICPMLMFLKWMGMR